jgi:alpha,alpha-trehalase
VIFDMDGVVTDTATTHARAWKAMFDEFLARRGGGSEPFGQKDYERHVDGKPRYDGVRSFLESRGIALDRGDPDDPPDRETIYGLGNRKNELFLERLREDGAERFEDAVDLVGRLQARGIRTAIISASRNAGEVLRAAGVADLFEIRIDGKETIRRGLRGKPAPDVFLEAARELGAGPDSAAVVEDAEAGVRAAREGGFHRVIGVARDGDLARLAGAGADAVVRELGEVRVGAQALQPIDALPDALEHVGRIAASAGDDSVVVFLDFDGTLSPIVDRPEDARLLPSARDPLAALSRRRVVAVVSGRDLDDVMGRVAIDGLWYVGGHGLQLARPGGGREEHPEVAACLPALERAARTLETSLRGIEGVQVERKRLGVAVHYRRAAAVAGDRVNRTVRSVAAQEKRLRIAEGRKVRELRPDVQWDKGHGVRWVLDLQGPAAGPVHPIYIGDDLTDEDAFRAVRERGTGIVVRGRDGATAARYVLDDPGAVARFLQALDRTLPRGGPGGGR